MFIVVPFKISQILCSTFLLHIFVYCGNIKSFKLYVENLDNNMDRTETNPYGYSKTYAMFFIQNHFTVRSISQGVPISECNMNFIQTIYFHLLTYFLQTSPSCLFPLFALVAVVSHFWLQRHEIFAGSLLNRFD